MPEIGRLSNSGYQLINPHAQVLTFGTGANVRRPPASQVADLAELLQGNSSG